MKKIGLALLCLLLACGVSAIVLFGIWNQYNPTAIIGSSIQTENTDVKEVTEQWFDEFFKQYEGPFVPFEFRIRDKRVKTIEVLNKEEGFVQLDYEFRPASDNPYVTSYYTAALQENGWYVAQVVLQLEKTLNGYTVKNKMSPVQYQIQTDPSLRKPPTTHYAMADRKETYAFSQNQLYVTYDAGKSFTEVPVPYEDIAGTNNSTYNELLPAHGYIVSRDFTAFVCYDETGSYLQYSEDMGKTWEKSRIISRTYRGDTLYLSKTENSCYITLTIPAHEVEILGSSFKPFVQMEYVYQEKGITYMIVAQGTDGDYIKNNALVKGRYKSKDGINFTFDKEISDSPTLAG